MTDQTIPVEKLRALLDQYQWEGFSRDDLARTLLAGAAALDTLDRVRAVLAGLRGEQEAALQRWDDTGDIWDGATSDTLQDTIHLLTEALGDTP